MKCLGGQLSGLYVDRRGDLPRADSALMSISGLLLEILLSGIFGIFS